jgi:hypothetical protein
MLSRVAINRADLTNHTERSRTGSIGDDLVAMRALLLITTSTRRCASARFLTTSLRRQSP